MLWNHYKNVDRIYNPYYYKFVWLLKRWIWAILPCCSCSCVPKPGHAVYRNSFCTAKSPGPTLNALWNIRSSRFNFLRRNGSAKPPRWTPLHTKANILLETLGVNATLLYILCKKKCNIGATTNMRALYTGFTPSWRLPSPSTEGQVRHALG